MRAAALECAQCGTEVAADDAVWLPAGPLAVDTAQVPAHQGQCSEELMLA